MNVDLAFMITAIEPMLSLLVVMIGVWCEYSHFKAIRMKVVFILRINKFVTAIFKNGNKGSLVHRFKSDTSRQLF